MWLITSVGSSPALLRPLHHLSLTCTFMHKLSTRRGGPPWRADVLCADEPPERVSMRLLSGGSLGASRSARSAWLRRGAHIAVVLEDKGLRRQLIQSSSCSMRGSDYQVEDFSCPDPRLTLVQLSEHPDRIPEEHLIDKHAGRICYIDSVVEIDDTRTCFVGY